MVQKASPKRGPRPFTERRVNSLKTRRERLPWPADKPFRILSLDGGGIRGIYAATILARVEARITNGEPIGDYFDAIAGTSTGGIIAIGLGLKKSAAQIQKLYTESGSQVFPEFWSRHPKLKFIRQLFYFLHDHRVLERLLYDTFQDATLGDSSARLVIPAFLGPETQIAVLKIRVEAAEPAWMPCAREGRSPLALSQMKSRAEPRPVYLSLREGSKPGGRDALAARFTRARPPAGGRDIFAPVFGYFVRYV